MRGSSFKTYDTEAKRGLNSGTDHVFRLVELLGTARTDSRGQNVSFPLRALEDLVPMPFEVFSVRQAGLSLWANQPCAVITQHPDLCLVAAREMLTDHHDIVCRQNGIGAQVEKLVMQGTKREPVRETLKYPLFSSSYRGCCTLSSDGIEEMAGETEIVFDDGLL